MIGGIKKTKGHWTEDEKRRFEEGFVMFGKDWKRIQRHVLTRTLAQIRSHGQNYILNKEREKLE